MRRSSSNLREQILTRCQGWCEWCGGALPDSFALHHRKLRSRGGEDSLPNLVALHHECHNLGTDSVHLNPMRATQAGFMVASWDEPDKVPILLHTTTRVFLSETYTRAEGN